MIQDVSFCLRFITSAQQYENAFFPVDERIGHLNEGLATKMDYDIKHVDYLMRVNTLCKNQNLRKQLSLYGVKYFVCLKMLMVVENTIQKLK